MKLTGECQCCSLFQSSSACLGSSYCCFKKNVQVQLNSDLNNTWPSLHSQFSTQEEKELLRVPQDSFSQLAWFPFLQPPPAYTGRPGFNQSISPSPRSALESSSLSSLTSTERWKGVEWARTIDFACRTLCLCRQDGICKHTVDYPRCQLQQRAARFATSKGRVSATCSLKSRSGHSRAGSAGSLWGLTPCPSAVGAGAHWCSPKLWLPPVFFLTLGPVLSLLDIIHRVCALQKGEISVTDMAPMCRHPKGLFGYLPGKRKCQ